VLARDLEPAQHEVTVTYASDQGAGGCRVSGFRILPRDLGDLSSVLNAEENGWFVDARAVVRRGDRIERNVLVWNWLTGVCLIAGLPKGSDYTLELIAYGWESRLIGGITIDSGKETSLSSLFLDRNRETRPNGVYFPAVGRPAITRPGEEF
jgi:hypothetical protein